MTNHPISQIINALGNDTKRVLPWIQNNEKSSIWITNSPDVIKYACNSPEWYSMLIRCQYYPEGLTSVREEFNNGEDINAIRKKVLDGVKIKVIELNNPKSEVLIEIADNYLEKYAYAKPIIYFTHSEGNNSKQEFTKKYLDNLNAINQVQNLECFLDSPLIKSNANKLVLKDIPRENLHKLELAF